MKLYLHSADPQQYAELSQYLSLAGMTTNLEMIASRKTEVAEQLNALLEVLPEGSQLFVHVAADNFRSILAEVRQLKKISEAIVPVITADPQGLMSLKACRTLHIAVAVDGIRSLPMAAFAQQNGAAWLLVDFAAFSDGRQALDLCMQISRLLEQETDCTLMAQGVTDTFALTRLMEEGKADLSLSIETAAALMADPVSIARCTHDQEIWMGTYGRLDLFE